MTLESLLDAAIKADLARHVGPGVIVTALSTDFQHLPKITIASTIEGEAVVGGAIYILKTAITVHVKAADPASSGDLHNLTGTIEAWHSDPLTSETLTTGQLRVWGIRPSNTAREVEDDRLVVTTTLDIWASRNLTTSH